MILPTLMHSPLNKKGTEPGTVKQHLKCRKSSKDKRDELKLIFFKKIDTII